MISNIAKIIFFRKSCMEICIQKCFTSRHIDNCFRIESLTSESELICEVLRDSHPYRTVITCGSHDFSCLCGRTLWLEGLWSLIVEQEWLLLVSTKAQYMVCRVLTPSSFHRLYKLPACRLWKVPTSTATHPEDPCRVSCHRHRLLQTYVCLPWVQRPHVSTTFIYDLFIYG